MWDLSSPTRVVLCIARQIFNHWTTREVPPKWFQMGRPQLQLQEWVHSSSLPLKALHSLLTMAQQGEHDPNWANQQFLGVWQAVSGKTCSLPWTQAFDGHFVTWRKPAWGPGYIAWEPGFSLAEASIILNNMLMWANKLSSFLKSVWLGVLSLINQTNGTRGGDDVKSTETWFWTKINRKRRKSERVLNSFSPWVTWVLSLQA